MKKILSILVVSVLLSVGVPLAALAACHGHGGAATLLGSASHKNIVCRWHGNVYIFDASYGCPGN